MLNVNVFNGNQKYWKGLNHEKIEHFFNECAAVL